MKPETKQKLKNINEVGRSVRKAKNVISIIAFCIGTIMVVGFLFVLVYSLREALGGIIRSLVENSVGDLAIYVRGF